MAKWLLLSIEKVGKNIDYTESKKICQTYYYFDNNYNYTI